MLVVWVRARTAGADDLCPAPAGDEALSDTRENSAPVLIRPNYGTGFEVFAALIRPAGASAKKNPAKRLSGRAGAAFANTDQCYSPEPGRNAWAQCARSLRALGAALTMLPQRFPHRGPQGFNPLPIPTP